MLDIMPDANNQNCIEARASCQTVTLVQPGQQLACALPAGGYGAFRNQTLA